MTTRLLLAAVCCTILLVGCEQKLSNDQYESGEVGKSRAVEFGTVLSVREVKIVEKKRGGGALLGAGAGGGGGSYIGNGSGSGWAAVGGAVAGAVIGDMIEREIRNSTGYEYVLEMRGGEVKTIVVEKIEGNPEIKSGAKVMLQYCDAGNEHVKRCADSGYQRLIPVDRFPSESKKAKKKTKVMVDDASADGK